MKKKINKLLIIIFIIFALFYTALSIVPHINFKTSAFDLGIFNQSIHSYSVFELGPNTIRNVPTLFADHLEIVMLIFTPLYWIFGSYTLLIIQIAFTLFGGLGVYLYVKKKTQNNETLAIIALIMFLINFGVIEALAYDFHNNVIGTMFIPWLLYFITERKIKTFYALLVLFLFTKENMSLIGVFLGISILIFEDKEIKKHGIFTFLLSISYFFGSIKIIELLNNGAYDHWSYHSLGESPREAIYFVMTNPLKTCSLLFDNDVKIIMWKIFLATGGVFAILKPKYAILLIPVFAQKFFSDNHSFWGYQFQYSIEFAPIIAIASVLAINSFFKKKNRIYILICMVLINIVIITQIRLNTGDTIMRIFNPSYYKKENLHELNEAIDTIKNAEYVSSQGAIIPHLKNKYIYIFPKINNSEYVILDKSNERIWPFKSSEEYLLNINELEKNANYEKIYDLKDIIIFKLHEKQNDD